MRCLQLIAQLRNQILNIPYHRGAQAKQAEKEYQTSADPRDKVQSNSLWKTWKGGYTGGQE